MIYDYLSCDGNADGERTYADCTKCGRNDHLVNMFKSRLIWGTFCEHCKDAIIKDEELENPGDPNNHKEKDFEGAY